MDKFFNQQSCDRCGGPLAEGRTMSAFTKECICMTCKAAEKARGDYHIAVAVEREAVRRGRRDFPGIGLGEWASESLRRLLPYRQRMFIESLVKSESEDTRREAQGIIASAEVQARAWENMPRTYETDGQGDNAVAYLHFFTMGRGDFWITEKDKEPRQLQAFGLSRILAVELGYISIEELQLSPMMELDFYWVPKTLREIKDELRDE